MAELKQLKIGRRVFRVVHQHLPKDHGTIIFNTNILRLDDPAPPFRRADTIIHEVLHGLWQYHGLPQRPTEERAVTALAQGLATVFRDNPGLATYIESLVREER